MSQANNFFLKTYSVSNDLRREGKRREFFLLELKQSIFLLRLFFSEPPQRKNRILSGQVSFISELKTGILHEVAIYCSIQSINRNMQVESKTRFKTPILSQFLLLSRSSIVIFGEFSFILNGIWNIVLSLVCTADMFTFTKKTLNGKFHFFVR